MWTNPDFKIAGMEIKCKNYRYMGLRDEIYFATAVR